MTNSFSKPIISSDLNITPADVKDWIFKTEEGKKCIVRRFKKNLKHEQKRQKRFLIPLMKKLDGKYEDMLIIMFRIHLLLCSIYKAIIDNNDTDFTISMEIIKEAFELLKGKLVSQYNERHQAIFMLIAKYRAKYIRILNKMIDFEKSGYFIL